MPDRITKEQRSYNMSKIKGKDTNIEVKVRKYLYHHGYRYRKNVKGLPGTPDILLTKQRIAIFVNGCFWHHHYNCKLAVYPKSRIDYWKSKIDKNVDNDVKNYNLLKQLDYKVMVIWECELNEAFDSRMKELIEEIENA